MHARTLCRKLMDQKEKKILIESSCFSDIFFSVIKYHHPKQHGGERVYSFCQQLEIVVHYRDIKVGTQAACCTTPRAKSKGKECTLAVCLLFSLLSSLLDISGCKLGNSAACSDLHHHPTSVNNQDNPE